MTKILIADDSAFARLRFKKALTQSGYDVIEACDGSQAVALYKSERPDGVLLDITMPGMDGITALEEIIKFDAAARIAMATALVQQRVVTKAMKAGAKDFLVKPFEPEQVLAIVGRLLG